MAYCPTCGSQTAGMFCTHCGAAVLTTSTTNPSAPAAASTAMNYATWATRVIGYLIDVLIVAPVMLIMYLLIGGMLATVASLGSRDAGGGMCCMMIVLFPLSSLLIGLYNRVYLISSRGYSIGQGVAGVKVVDSNGGLLSQGAAFIRLLAQVGMGFIPFLPLLDLLWPLWDERRQTLHDKAINCYVINR